MEGIYQAQQQLLKAAARLAAHGWLRATSGNLSLKLADRPLTIAITRSGADKAELHEDDIIVWRNDQVIWDDGQVSAECGVHQAIYQRAKVNAVFHVHTVANNLASARTDAPCLEIRGNEMLKALGFWQEDAVVRLPVIENHSNLEHLALAARKALVAEVPGLLIRNHGLYAFGTTVKDSLRHLEAFEFLFEWLLTA